MKQGLIVRSVRGEFVAITYGTNENGLFAESFGGLKVAGAHTLRRGLDPPSGDWGSWGFGGICSRIVMQKHPCVDEVENVAFTLFGDGVSVLYIIVCDDITENVPHSRQ